VTTAETRSRLKAGPTGCSTSWRTDQSSPAVGFIEQQNGWIAPPVAPPSASAVVGPAEGRSGACCSDRRGQTHLVKHGSSFSAGQPTLTQFQFLAHAQTPGSERSGKLKNQTAEPAALAGVQAADPASGSFATGPWPGRRSAHQGGSYPSRLGRHQGPAPLVLSVRFQAVEARLQRRWRRLTQGFELSMGGLRVVPLAVAVLEGGLCGKRLGRWTSISGTWIRSNCWICSVSPDNPVQGEQGLCEHGVLKVCFFLGKGGLQR